MIDLLILVTIVAGAIVGMRRGLILQGIHLIGVVLSLIIAWIFYKPLADRFEMLIPYPGVTASTKLIIPTDDIDVDRTFYRLFAYVLIFIIAKILLQIVASAFQKYAYLSVFPNWNRIGGALLAIVEVYIVLYILLSLVAMLPLDMITDRLDGSLFAGFIVNYSPILSTIFKHIWYLYI